MVESDLMECLVLLQMMEQDQEFINRFEPMYNVYIFIDDVLDSYLDLIIFLLDNDDLCRDHCLQIIKMHGLNVLINRIKDGDVEFSLHADIKQKALDMINDYL